MVAGVVENARKCVETPPLFRPHVLSSLQVGSIDVRVKGIDHFHQSTDGAFLQENFAMPLDSSHSLGCPSHDDDDADADDGFADERSRFSQNFPYFAIILLAFPQFYLCQKTLLI